MAEKKKKRKPPKRSGEYKSYKVKKGDTLSKIADKNHVSLSDLLRWNTDIKDANKVSAGTHLRIPTIKEGLHPNVSLDNRNTFILYTSDAADCLSCVDLRGHRIITKKQNDAHKDENSIPNEHNKQ